MAHFEVDAKHQESTVTKDILVDSFKTHLLPIIKPFILPQKTPDSVPICEDSSKLDLTANSTTKLKLRNELKKYVPTLKTTHAMGKTELVTLYQKYIMNESNASQGSRFMKKPPRWNLAELHQARLDDIRYALQFYRPDIFITHKSSTVEICKRIYEKFLLNMPIQADVITEGVHYYIRQLE
ncbi:uncharacterized protein MELLADRAFT_61474 [Melampsora larici-populina 98AG31]|uniref:Uncharacterized protein n=1 Tax=Melampsora larici-populina (strain 98AG31 / pathotype 3-4-7) TaxID=747676 RepID=F4RF14_MELLP|nr:uncharacterized protein MELLADRAFT_61474 [Melampsora larici-populina 98AG31]EGG08738.1 hypothetical protein MELLADRAFT_61474 [Melampsora larici-populina 98AG31]